MGKIKRNDIFISFEKQLCSNASTLSQSIANTEEKIGSFWYFYKRKTTNESASITSTSRRRWYHKMDARTLKAKESIDNRPHKQKFKMKYSVCNTGIETSI